MQSSEKGGVIVIRLIPDEDFYDSLKEACKKHSITTAVVLSGIGMLKDFEFGYFRKKGDYAQKSFKAPHELIALSGLISKNGEGEYDFHIHAAVASKDKKMFGGHLLKAKVNVTNEIALLMSEIKLKRKAEDDTGLMGLFLE